MTTLFLDSEWATDALRELVSIALISEDGEHVFYAERDPIPSIASSFVRRTVYPLLDRGAAALPDDAMTVALRAFLGALGPCQILADAPLDFTMLARVWKGRDVSPPPAPYTVRLVRDQDLMDRLEAYFQREPAELARRHHALVDARALRKAWLSGL